MANIASLLKAEIARVARKEVRAEIESLRKANSQHRAAIAELKRELAALQKQLKQADRERTASARQEAAAERKHRFSAAPPRGTPDQAGPVSRRLRPPGRHERGHHLLVGAGQSDLVGHSLQGWLKWELA